MTQIELLAPAKDLECAVAAIDCGADAVYIGAPRFGAREAAGNSMADIAELVRYAHKYWAKVYVTVNTLLRDDEISHALRLISQLYDAGIDALIIQDTGLLECDLPPLPLIASTQMHNNTPERVAFLGKVGFQRAILARELDMDQIKAIRQRTNIELEFFIHGALCVGYSGQCYLSYALGGRSGNRGQCAQPCRKPYTLFDRSGKILATNKHLLSLRDLNLTEYIRELIEAGICSFKIEGRLKDKAYVTNVVAHYRAQIDRVLADFKLSKSSSGTSTVNFEPNVCKTFNRGYSAHFLHGRSERIGSNDTPKMIGEPLGNVISMTGQDITLDSTLPVHNGDGVCFFDSAGELRGTLINGVRGRTLIPDKMDGIEKGTLIYRNVDSEFLTRLNKSRAQRLIGVALTLSETPDGLLLTAVDEDGNKAESPMVCEKTPADKPDQALENIRKQLAKSGGTDFTCSSVEVDLSQPYFLPMSALNALRRGTLEKLAEIRAENRPKPTGGIVPNDVPHPEKILTFTGNVLNRRAEAFYQRHGVTSIEPAAESGLNLRSRRVMRTRYCLRHQLDLCPKSGSADRGAEPLTLVSGEGHELELRFDCAKCEMEVYLTRT